MVSVISSDWPAPGSTIYFVRGVPNDINTLDIYQATWVPEGDGQASGSEPRPR